jgi:hypothetical protein
LTAPAQKTFGGGLLQSSRDASIMGSLYHNLIPPGKPGGCPREIRPGGAVNRRRFGAYS